MSTMLSARRGLALIADGERWISIDIENPEAIERSPSEIPWLLGEALDFEPLDSTDLDQVRRHLVRVCNREDALQLVLMTLDLELSDDLRSEAAEELEKLLADDTAREDLERVLYACPLPETADIVGSLALASKAALEFLGRVLKDLERRQPLVADVHRAWSQIPSDMLAEDASLWRATVVREGLFRDLILDLEARPHPKALEFGTLKVMENLQLQSLPNFYQILRLLIETSSRGTTSQLQDFDSSQQVTDRQPTLAASTRDDRYADMLLTAWQGFLQARPSVELSSSFQGLR